MLYDTRIVSPTATGFVKGEIIEGGSGPEKI